MKNAALKTLLCSALLILPAMGKTRRSANHIIPDADFPGTGSLSVGYEGFLHSNEKGDDYFVQHLVPVELGVSEWLTITTGWADGMTLGLKGRILDEYNPVMPSLAIGVRDLFNSTTLARAGLDNDSPEVTSEVYLALSKGFDLITTRFHGGISSIPGSETEKFNGFFGVEKYFGGNFYLTFEGWTMYDRLNMALFGTFRFLPEKRGELYVGAVDLERLFFNQKSDLEMSFETDFDSDPVKPGICFGFTMNFNFPIGGQTQFRTLEDLYVEQRSEIEELRKSQDTLKDLLIDETLKRLELQSVVDSLGEVMPHIDTIPQYYEEIYARLLLYRRGYETKPFNPLIVRSVREEIFAFEDHAENSLIYLLQKGDRNVRLELDAVSLLGMMKSNKAVPFLLEKLGVVMDRKYKIEIISSLGMIGDRGATYALEQLVNSGDESVAIAAGEVLRSWEQGAPVSDSSTADEEFIIE